MTRWMVGAMIVAALVAGAALAQEGKGKKVGKAPTRDGVWVREVGDTRVEFAFKGAKLTVSLKKGDQTVRADSDIGFSKDGHVFGRIYKVTPENLENGPKVGMLFSIRTEVKGDTMTISDLQVEGANQEVRDLVEGEYTRRKKE